MALSDPEVMKTPSTFILSHISLTLNASMPKFLSNSTLEVSKSQPITFIPKAFSACAIKIPIEPKPITSAVEFLFSCALLTARMQQPSGS